MSPSFEIDFPIRSWYRGEPVPALRKIDRSRWREAVTPLSHGARMEGAQAAPKRGVLDPEDAMILVTKMELEDGGRRTALGRVAERPPTQTPPRASTGEVRNTRQMNVRLSLRQFAELATAAALLGMKPTQLARQFILAGTGPVLYQHRRQAPARQWAQTPLHGPHSARAPP